MELFDFGIPALDKALNLTATVLLLLALGMLLIRVILRLCDRAFDRSERLAPFRTYLRSTLRAVLYILLALAVLGSIGVEITSFVALLSVAGLAVSLSLQNTLSNVAGGVMLLISKPFTVGDYVSCDGIEGAVRAVDLAYTTFTTVDNKEIFVPNSQIVTAKIVNYNALGRRRVDLTYTASYDAPTETVRTAILEAVAAFPQVAGEPEDFARIRDIILEIMPCHLQVDFYFRFLTWEECEAAAWTWQGIEDAGHTWESFEKAVPTV